MQTSPNRRVNLPLECKSSAPVSCIANFQDLKNSKSRVQLKFGCSRDKRLHVSTADAFNNNSESHCKSSALKKKFLFYKAALFSAQYGNHKLAFLCGLIWEAPVQIFSITGNKRSFGGVWNADSGTICRLAFAKTAERERKLETERRAEAEDVPITRRI